MRDHFTQAIQARDAIIRGDLAAMKVPAKWLADGTVSETLPEDWKPYVAHLQNIARLALQAKELAEAASAIGAMGAACGDCHAELGVTRRLLRMSPEGQLLRAPDRMLRHPWAADRMWEGLIRPSDRAWSAGAGVLQETTLRREMLADNNSPPRAVVALADAVRILGQLGSTMPAWSARARLYGDYVATCAACHSMLGVQQGSTRPPHG